jgi:glycosyltransferase involved in cell wall biosynthesis
MRLLFLEPSYSGGTITVSRQVLPEFARLAEIVVWAAPQHLQQEFESSSLPGDRVVCESPTWDERSHFFRHLDGLIRRITQLGIALPFREFLGSLRQRISDARLRFLIRKYRLTHCFSPWIFNQPFPHLGIPVGAMVMDLNWHHFPGNFPDQDLVSLDSAFEKWVRNSDILFPVSEFTSSELHRAFPACSGKVRVVPHGAQPVASACLGPGNPEISSSEKPFLYYPASVLAHKNHLQLIRAAVDLFKAGLDFDLVLTGGGTDKLSSKTPASEPAVEDCRKFLTENESIICGRIRCLGVIPRTEVDRLYRTCRAVVLPTLFEGFGLPLIEAIGNMAPVICSDIPAFIEQIRRHDLTNHVRLLPAGDPAALTVNMREALTSPRCRFDEGEIAAKLSSWTWKDAAQSYLEAMLELPQLKMCHYPGARSAQNVRAA